MTETNEVKQNENVKGEDLVLEEKTESKLNIYKKVFELQRVLSSYDWEKDGRNTFQRYKYITEAQYKRNFSKALLEVGLVWTVEEVSHLFRTDVLDNMHLVDVQFKGTLIDIETGEYLDYFFSGTGSDNGDKGIYKAYTGGLKYFIATNFMIAEHNDVEDDSNPVNQVPATKTERKTIKNNLTNGQASPMQIDTLKKQLNTLWVKDKSSKAFIAKINKETKGLTDIDSVDCENYILEVGRMLNK